MDLWIDLKKNFFISVLAHWDTKRGRKNLTVQNLPKHLCSAEICLKQAETNMQEEWQKHTTAVQGGESQFPGVNHWEDRTRKYGVL